MTEVKKYKLIKKILIPILTLGIFLLPLSPSLEIKNKQFVLESKINTAFAVDYENNFVPKPTIEKIGEAGENYVNVKITITAKEAGELYTGKNVATAEITGSTANGQPIIKIDNGGLGYTKNPTVSLKGGTCSIIGTTLAKFDKDGIITEITASGWTCSVAPTSVLIESASNMYDTYGSYTALEGNGIDPSQGFFIDIQNDTKNTTTSVSFLDLGLKLDILSLQNILNIKIGSAYIAPDTDYTLILRAEEGNSTNTFKYGYVKFKTLAAGSTPPPDVTTGGVVNSDGKNPLDLDCGVFNIPGCVAQLFYMVFTIAAFIGKLAAWFLDFFLYYSTNCTSYVSGFISKGWSAIRDVSNIFFIIALLYISIKTILGLNVSDNKKMIGTIVIVALIINFSLFTTQVIIDSTNILAKIFYNSIEITNQNSEVSATGEKSVSVALISKFNPQKLVSKEVYNEDGGVSLFIFITILATAIVLYAAYIFFSVALLFVSRVVSLWIYMIFSPIAFASYTLPFDIPGFGHKEWWSEVLKNAFLAPIFIFFLYIIVMFTDFLSEIVKFPEGASFMQKVMAVVIPFALLAVLLIKAKELAIKYAGEMGKMVQKIGAFAGGVALGAATGGLAMAGRATVGRAGSALANSEWAKKREAEGKFGGATLRNIGKSAGKGSFDARGIKIMGKDLASTGLSVGKAKDGGFEKMRKDKVEKRVKRAKELEVGEDSSEKQALNKYEGGLQSVLAQNKSLIDDLDKDIEVARQNLSDAAPKDKKAMADKLKTAKTAKTTFRDSTVDPKTGLSISQLEKNYIPMAKNVIAGINSGRREDYGKTISSDWNKFKNKISSGFQHSGAGADEASHKIRMDIKLDSGTKTS